MQQGDKTSEGNKRQFKPDEKWRAQHREEHWTLAWLTPLMKLDTSNHDRRPVLSYKEHNWDNLQVNCLFTRESRKSWGCSRATVWRGDFYHGCRSLRTKVRIWWEAMRPPLPTAAPDVSEKPLRQKYAKQLIKRGADGRCDDWDERLIYLITYSAGRVINQSEFSSEPREGPKNSVVCLVFRGCVWGWTVEKIWIT